MKMTEELKNKIEAAETKEEVKEILANSGMELTDEELDTVAGGGIIPCKLCLGTGKNGETACLRCDGTGQMSIVRQGFAFSRVMHTF